MAQGFPTDFFGYSSLVNIEEVVSIGGASSTSGAFEASGSALSGRAITLRGSALPFMGAEWGFENQLVTTWYPGNPEATQQLLGPRELPSTWEGEWKRTLLGRTPVLYRDSSGEVQRLVEPHLVREVLEDMARRGQRLRVTWAVQGSTLVGSTSDPGRALHNEDVSIVREGRVKSFKTPIDRHTDIRWTIEFHWAGRGGQAQKAVAVREDVDSSTIANGISSAIGAMSGAVSDSKMKHSASLVPRSASKFTLGQLEALAGLPSLLVKNALRQLTNVENQFKRVGDVVRRATSQLVEMNQAVDNFATNSKAIANNYRDVIGRVPFELKSNKDRPAAALRAAMYFDASEDAAGEVARQALLVRSKLQLPVVVGGLQGGASQNSGTRAARPGDLLASYVTRDGDTPQSVAVRFYGTPDRAADLLRANRLPAYTPSFTRGVVLAVPAAGAMTRRRTGI